MAAQFVGEELETPGNIHVAIERADAAEFAIDERLLPLGIAFLVVESRAFVGLRNHAFNVRPRFCVVVDVEMPGIDVGIAMGVIMQVLPMDHAHVLDEPGGVQGFRQFPHLLHPALRTPVLQLALRLTRKWLCEKRVGVLAEVFDEFHLAAKSPRLVEEAPRNERRVVPVTLHPDAHHCFKPPPPERSVAAFAEIGKILHEQDAHGVGVVE